MSFLSPSTIELIQKAQALWAEHFGRNIQFFSESHRLDALEADGPDGIILALELSRLAHEAAGMCSFTAADLISNGAEVQAKIDTIRAIQAAAEAPEIQRLLLGCREKLRAAAEAFGAGAKIEPVLANTRLGELLRTAESEFRSLTVHQYAQGEGKRERFHLNSWIYAFPSMHELVCAIARQPVDGLTLCVVIDPDIIEYSVFAWALKTGATLTVLSQDNGLSHRGQKFMRRNPGRDFERRAEGCFYPYSIFTYEETRTASGSGSQVRIAGMFRNGEAPAGNAIVKHEIALHKMRPICDLTPEEITWLLLIADLIHRDYWEHEKKTPELAYTGEMLESPQVVPHAAQ